MTLSPNAISQDELMAFVDGVLDSERAQQIEQCAEQDANLAATIAALRAQRQALRASLDPVLNEPIPLRLLQISAPVRFSFQRIAAAMIWMTVGLTVGSLTS